MDTKAELRQRFRMLRDGVAASHRERYSAAIASRVLALPWTQQAHRIALYAALGSEVDTRHVFAALRQRGVVCCYPAVQPDRQLQFVDVSDVTHLLPGAYGIDEPAGEAVPLEAVDAMIIPGLAFDSQGTRLGYGAGYYDRALARYNGVRIGLAYAQQVLPVLPAAAHDQAMDVIVTEVSVIAVSARARQALGPQGETAGG